MAKRKPSARQKQYRELEKLRDQGLYRGRIDKRRKISKYQFGILNKFVDVIKGAAKVLAPLHPKNYKNIFRVVRDKVIVPKAKNEKVRVNKRGEIERTRRGPRGEKITSTAKRTPPQQIPPRPPEGKRIQYAVPFARKVGPGKYKMEWHRFPTWEMLNEFMSEYQKEGRYQDWLNYVFEEEISEHTRTEKNKALDEALIKYGRVRNADEIVMAGRRVRARRKKNRQGKSYKY